MIIIESHSIYNNIGESGATSLSEALKVNSSLTQLDLRVSLLMNMINWSLLNLIPFVTILVIQGKERWPVLWNQTSQSQTLCFDERIPLFLPSLRWFEQMRNPFPVFISFLILWGLSFFRMVNLNNQNITVSFNQIIFIPSI